MDYLIAGREDAERLKDEKMHPRPQDIKMPRKYSHLSINIYRSIEGEFDLRREKGHMTIGLNVVCKDANVQISRLKLYPL
ncbi:MAG: hypothetical protein ABR572_04065 [Cryomorphaceae bacterium]